MEFAVICPIAGLEKYASLSQTHLVLAQVQDSQYRSFYKERRLDGDTIILDNGAYEQGRAITEETFVEAIRYYNPQYIVCPDILYEPWENTYALTKHFLDKYYDEFKENSEFIGVPQTTKGDIMGWIEGVLRMVEELPLDGIGLPRALVTHYYIDPLTRVRACEFLRKRYNRHEQQLYIHAFGMVKGNVDELNMLEKAGCDSIDSSAPVWRGWSLGLTLDNQDHHVIWDQCGIECDFNTSLKVKPENHRRILDNLSLCGVEVPSDVNSSTNR